MVTWISPKFLAEFLTTWLPYLLKTFRNPDWRGAWVTRLERPRGSKDKVKRSEEPPARSRAPEVCYILENESLGGALSREAGQQTHSISGRQLEQRRRRKCVMGWARWHNFLIFFSDRSNRILLKSFIEIFRFMETDGKLVESFKYDNAPWDQ